VKGRLRRACAKETWVHHRGDLTWDGIVWGSGIVALLAIPATLFLPQVGPLVGFGLVTVWVNGPIGPFLPATYEPILMVFGRLYPPGWVALLGIAGIMYVEYLNYHLYSHVLHAAALQPVRRGRFVTATVKLFSAAPFFTVWLCSWSPLPYWSVRLVAPLAGYPVGRYLVATFLGRFPRLWFFAALGIWWHVDTGVLALIALGSIILALAVYSVARSRRPAELAHVPAIGGIEHAHQAPRSQLETNSAVVPPSPRR
jgi:hypothetical protein